MYLLLLLGVGIVAVMMANRGLANPSLLQAWPASTFMGGPALHGVHQVLAGVPGPGNFVLLQDTAHGGIGGAAVIVKVTGTGVATPSGSTILPGLIVNVQNPPGSFASTLLLPGQTALFNLQDAFMAAPDLATAQQIVAQTFAALSA